MASRKTLESPDCYEVAWIAALQIEKAAAIVMLDEEHAPPIGFIKHQTDHNVYTWGRVGNHNIVIVSLASGVYGSTSAAITASSLLASFPSIRVGLMVGIGGGVARPDKGYDIRLGDIVVGHPSGTLGGVCQYDMIKAKADNEHERTGFLGRPPTVLLNALTEIQARHEIEDPKIPIFLKEILEKNPKMSKRTKKSPGYSHQGFENDRLFKSSYDHISGLDCQNCDAANEVQRDPRETSDPDIHYGIIASGNTLVKDAATRDRIANDIGDNCICFEMEAAGLMNHFPCLVIRGICDYADSHKNDRWQRYASATAAAYAKELLAYLPPADVKKTKRASEVLRLGTRNGVQRGTGQWFLSDPKYLSWLETRGQRMFCHGIPGAGKTCMTAIVIDDLHQRFANLPDIGIVYFYCSRYKQNQKQDGTLQLSFLKQLARQYWKKSREDDPVNTLFQSHERMGTKPQLEEIEETISSLAVTFDRIFVIVDALDEWGHPGNLPDIFIKVKYPNTSLFATSRPIEETIRKFKGSICLKIQAHDSDLDKYLDVNLVNGGSSLLRGRNMDYRRKSTKERIKKCVDGMFLLLKLYLDEIKEQTNEGDLDRTLAKFEKRVGSELEEILSMAYNGVIERVKAQPRPSYNLGKKVLWWISCARKDLSVLGLRQALAVAEDSTAFEKENMPGINEIVSACAGLVIMDNAANTFRISHYTALEYLTQQVKLGTDEFLGAPEEIARVCMKYLSFDLRLWPEDDDRHNLQTLSKVRLSDLEDIGTDLRRDFLNHHPFFDYASRNWAYHVNQTTFSPEETLETLSRFLPGGTLSPEILVKNFKSISLLRVLDLAYTQINLKLLLDVLGKGWGFETWLTPKIRGGLHAAAYFGLPSLVELLLLQESSMLNDCVTHSQTPLSYAAERGHEAMVQKLLDHCDIKVNTRDQDGKTALSHAAENGHEPVVKQLLNHPGIEVNTFDGRERTTLSYAAKNGHEAVVNQLLNYPGIEVNQRDLPGRTALSHAAANGHEEVVKQLLGHSGIEVNISDVFGRTALSYAAGNSGEAVVKQLLNCPGIKVNIPDKHGQTALFHAAKYGKSAVVELLLEQNMDPNQQDLRGQTPLRLAVLSGRNSVVKILLPKMKHREKYLLQDVLERGLSRENSAIFTTLVIQGGLEYEDNTPLLHLALRMGCTELIKHFLGNGFDFETLKFKKHEHPLWIAALEGHHELVKFLSSFRDFDMGLKKKVLEHALRRRDLAMAESLLADKKDVMLLNERDDNGKAAVHHAANYGYIEFIEYFMGFHGIELTTEDINGQTPLSLAARCGHSNIVSLLLRVSGVDPKTGGRNGQGPLFQAAQHGHAEVVDLLLGNEDLDRLAQDINGYTPLEIAIQYRHPRVVKRLLEDSITRDIVESGQLGGRINAALLNTSDEVLELFLDMNIAF
ncbi:Pfs NACHT and Ankyrin domain protein [Penicillium herquei]|nr:Pfs NACHT and Ankyrin domain protein [Penicillium herquei]